MNILTNSRILAACASAALFFGAVSSSEAQLAGEGDDGAQPIATGQGSLFDPADGNIRVFSFNIVELADGSIKGQGQLVTPAVGLRIHWTMNSYLVDDDGSVFFTGTITKVDGPGPPEGFIIICAVQDNDGDGGQDTMTFANAGPPAGPLGPVFSVQDIIDILAFFSGLPPTPDLLFMPFNGPPLLSPYFPIVTGNINVF